MATLDHHQFYLPANGAVDSNLRDAASLPEVDKSKSAKAGKKESSAAPNDELLPHELRGDTDGFTFIDLRAGHRELGLIYFHSLAMVPNSAWPAGVPLAEASKRKAFVGLHDIAGVRVEKLEPCKPPSPKDSVAHAVWQYWPAPPQSVSVCERTYVYIGQIPSWMSAATLYEIFVKATGLIPLRVDRLPKGSKVFLQSRDEVQRAHHFTQTVQVTEYDVIYADDRDHLLRMRRAIDQHLKACFKQNPDMFPNARTVHEHQSGPKQAHQPLVRVGADDRNGLYPMTIEEGQPSTKKPKATKRTVQRPADPTPVRVCYNPYRAAVIVPAASAAPSADVAQPRAGVSEAVRFRHDPYSTTRAVVPVRK
uniref:Uncharacterized protein n=1 Tax=Neobodo designis TaxID=312471 RepID=A0A7S1LYY0_NEODS|eukprot:CAMPEP_0174831616 /NCGR_PEP_ID=MMETSP1114-20130205/3198_1 /TAXON_ID=312471 /ORGANISM="Neobodo designis, Strain CCAP 1951/1" /LENGTH=364 /DNA_ID=CAMNT_0016065445 /DNA_START=56 /DNA_END=1150 /DNA_ORIENTATION=-